MLSESDLAKIISNNAEGMTMSTLVNPVGWFEIHVADMDRAKMFYESVFKRTLIETPAPEAGMSMMIFASDPQGSGASGALVKHPMRQSKLLRLAKTNCQRKNHLAQCLRRIKFV